MLSVGRAKSIYLKQLLATITDKTRIFAAMQGTVVVNPLWFDAFQILNQSHHSDLRFYLPATISPAATARLRRASRVSRSATARWS